MRPAARVHVPGRVAVDEPVHAAVDALVHAAVVQQARVEALATTVLRQATNVEVEVRQDRVVHLSVVYVVARVMPDHVEHQKASDVVARVMLVHVEHPSVVYVVARVTQDHVVHRPLPTHAAQAASPVRVEFDVRGLAGRELFSARQAIWPRQRAHDELAAARRLSRAIASVCRWRCGRGAVDVWGRRLVAARLRHWARYVLMHRWAMLVLCVVLTTTVFTK